MHQLRNSQRLSPLQGQHKFIAVLGNLHEGATTNKKLNDQSGLVTWGANTLVPLRHTFPHYVILGLLP